ncbi:hypothetical protein B0H14DRAFT_3513954 [Mycena olivaceomarginata]|nr:hypothetical protein B0H14DRAFT_3513954 [Mycena olivaceomarginata]
MATALARVDRDVIPYPVAGLAADTRYVLPEPALFANSDSQRRRRFLHHWNLLRDGFLFMLANRPQLLAPQQWQGCGARNWKMLYSRHWKPATVKSLEGFPVPDKFVPEFSLGETREIIWDVAETSFHFEFCALE